MNRVTTITILMFLTAAGAYAADELTAEAEYEWVNIPARRDVADLLPSGEGYYAVYRGGGAAFYDIDDRNYRLYGLKQGLTHLYVSGVAEDDTHLYLATRNGLTKLDKETGEYERVIRMWGNAYNDCTGIAVTDRYVYVCTIEGARRFDKQFGPPVEVMNLKPGDRPLSKQVDDGWEVYYNPDDVVTEDLYSVVVGPDGTVYWGGYNRVPVQYPDDSWSIVRPDVELGNITRMRFISGSLAVFGTAAGGYFLDTDTGHCEPMLTVLDNKQLNDGLVFGDYTYLGGRDGLYVARNNGKKFKMPLGTPVESIGMKRKKKKSALWLVSDDIGGAEVNRIIEVGDIIVIGTTGGVYHYDPDDKTLTKPGIPEGLSGPAVYSLLHDGETLWAASSGGADRITLGDNSFKPIITASFPTSETLRDIAILDGYTTFLAQNRLFHLIRYTLIPETYLPDVGITEEVVCLCTVDRPTFDRLYIGTKNGLIEVSYQLTMYEDLPQHKNHEIVGLVALNDVLYIATRFNGVYGLSADNRYEHSYFIGAETGLSGKEILSLYADEENVYVGFYDKGVDILTPELDFVDNITWGDGLSHTDIFAVAYDAPYLWVSIRDVGVNAFNLETGERDDIRKYYARYGLGDEFCRDIEVLGPGNGYDHRIAFATASGVSILCYDGGTPPDLTVDDVDKGYK
ncbi:MAG: hypothetical protein GY771_05495 [bacterium]|nr:hypothetical protein [bacterium]